MPSDPDVNRITAGSSGRAFCITRRGLRTAHSINQSFVEQSELFPKILEIDNTHVAQLPDQVSELCLLDKSS